MQAGERVWQLLQQVARDRQHLQTAAHHLQVARQLRDLILSETGSGKVPVEILAMNKRIISAGLPDPYASQLWQQQAAGREFCQVVAVHSLGR